MRIQGWGLKDAAHQSAIPSRGTKRGGGKKLPVSDLFKEETVSSASDAGDRTELLSKIQQRIRAGFYNSDAVIEDLGFGFAQALDHTL
jgi:hypothetical protein